MDPIANNFVPDAVINDGSCLYSYMNGHIATMGYITNCLVYGDTNDNAILDAGEQSRRSSDSGAYLVPYVESAPTRVLFNLTNGDACRDSLQHSQLTVRLETTTSASMASSLTTVASHLINRTDGSGGLIDEAAAGHLVCQRLTACVPCAMAPRSECIVETGCANACKKTGKGLSAFTYDALDVLVGEFFDPLWTGWMASQVNAEKIVTCARAAVMCASATLCGSRCDNCDSVGDHTGAEVDAALWGLLADMTQEGRLVLEDAAGTAVVELMGRAGVLLGVTLIDDYLSIAGGCAVNMNTFYRVIVLDEASTVGMLPEPVLTQTREGTEAFLTRACRASWNPGDRACVPTRIGCMHIWSANFDPVATVHRQLDC